MAEKIKAYADVYNMSLQQATIKLYVAMYKNSSLEKLEIKTIDIEDSDVLFVETEFVDVPKGCTDVKAFIWNGSGLKPVRITNCFALSNSL